MASYGKSEVCTMEEPEGRARVIIEGVKPEIDSGRFPIKEVIDEKIVIEADTFADGHDTLTLEEKP